MQRAVDNTRHRALSKSTSGRRIPRTSPGRHMVSDTIFSAAVSVGHPSYSSIFNLSAPSFFSSTIAGRCCTFGRSSAPRRANVGSFFARKVTIANRNTPPMTPRRRRALSRRPLFSMRLSKSRSSAEMISAIGRVESVPARSSRSHRFFPTVVSAAPFSLRLERYSVTRTPKVLLASVSEAMRSSLRCTDGSVPAATNFFASSRLVRASANPMIG